MNLERLKSDECKAEKYILRATETNRPGYLSKKGLRSLLHPTKTFTLVFSAVNQTDERERTASRNYN